MGRPPKKRGGKKGDGEVINLTFPGFEPPEEPEPEDEERTFAEVVGTFKPRPVRRGRPPKIDDEGLVDAVVSAIRSGVPKSLAAAAAGIHPVTITRWVDRAHQHDPDDPDDDNEPYAHFLIRIQQAEAEFIQSVVGSMSMSDSRNARFILERLHSSIFGAQPKVAVTATATAASASKAEPKGIDAEQIGWIRKELLGVPVAASGEHDDG